MSVDRDFLVAIDVRRVVEDEGKYSHVELSQAKGHVHRSQRQDERSYTNHRCAQNAHDG